MGTRPKWHPIYGKDEKGQRKQIGIKILGDPKLYKGITRPSQIKKPVEKKPEPTRSNKSQPSKKY